MYIRQFKLQETKMIKTYKYRLQPNKEQEILLNSSFEICRLLYNLALEQRISSFKQFNKSLNYFSQANQLKELKTEFPEFKNIHSQVLQDVLKRLDKAFQNFFRRLKSKQTPGFPRFKGFGRYSSITYPQFDLKTEGKKISVPKIGLIKFKFCRKFPELIKIKTATITRSLTGKFFISITFDNLQEIPKKISINPNKVIGIDLGINHFLVTSKNEYIDNPKYLKQSLEKLAHQQQLLSRKTKGSNNRSKQKFQVAKVYEKVSNQRKDFLHKLSTSFVNQYDCIIAEDLNINSMLQGNKHQTTLHRSISDASWGQFTGMLSYKAEEAGKHLILVNPRGTSQTCSNCGAKVEKKLWDRIHKCPECQISLNRDFNSSLYIEKIGKELPEFKLVESSS